MEGNNRIKKLNDPEYKQKREKNNEVIYKNKIYM